MTDERLREAFGAVIDRWYHLGLIRFGSRDDGGDDLLLRDELVRAALAATPEPTLDAALWEVRYDDDEAYFVAARFITEAAADRLRDRLLAAHTEADKDDCHLESAWFVVRIEADNVDPEDPLPDDLFDNSSESDEHHAMVNIDRLPILPLAARLGEPNDD